jgi:hypothetical protein
MTLEIQALVWNRHTHVEIVPLVYHEVSAELFTTEPFVVVFIYI